MLRASQIAYFLIDEVAIKEMQDWYEFKKIPQEARDYTLLELYAHSEIFKEEIYKKIKEVSELKDDLSVFIELDKVTVLSRIENPAIRERVAEMYDIIDDIENDRYGIGSWKVRSFVWNDVIGRQGQVGNFVDGAWNIDNFSSSGNGLCAMVFETEENNAIVAFRGSDAMTTEGAPDVNNLLTDWIASDGGLALGDQDTPQQETAYRYMKDYVLKLGYDNLFLTGHSLGGNLAMHAAVSAYEISSEKAINISKVVGFDSPGYSDGYMKRHSDALSKIEHSHSTNITHYEWSLVGVLLEQFGFTNDWTALVNYNDPNNSSIDVDSAGFMFDRHDTAFPQLDSNGNMLGGNRNAIMHYIDELVQYIVDYPEFMTPDIINLAISIIDYVVTDIKNETLSINEILGTFINLLDFKPVGETIIDGICAYYSPVLLLYISNFLLDDGRKSFISFFVDDTYKLSEMLAKNKHEINDSHGKNIIYFPEGIKPENVKTYLEGDNDIKIVLEYDNGNEDYVIMRKYRKDTEDKQFKLIFTYDTIDENGNVKQEGAVMDANYHSSPFRTLYGTSEDDRLTPLFNDNYGTVMNGGDGNDNLIGSAGDDFVDGGKGDDSLFGGMGNDTYLINKNSGIYRITDTVGNNI